MFPQMTETQNEIMMKLQTAKTGDLDPFEMQMRGQAGKLSMQIDQLGGLVNNLRNKLTDAEKEQNTLVGEFQGVVMAIEAYHLTKARMATKKPDAEKKPDEEQKQDTAGQKEDEEKSADKKAPDKGNKSKK